MNEPCFIDTNILMYAVGGEHPLKKSCQEIIKKIFDRSIYAVTNTEVFQEIAYRYWSLKKWKLARQILDDYEMLFDEILPIEKKHLKLYYHLLETMPQLSPRDAIHLAVMQTNNITHIYTTDAAFKKIPHIKVLL
ncbi:type II toxin-antitoxin system VapC family toxin [bacterium]|nr:type II toxin-antitoxin system VapC family toxin [bacterium]